MQGITRKFTPSVETPLNVVIVDEMGYLSVYMPDKRLRERADKAIAAILSYEIRLSTIY
jgi:S-DNA-T family DNA segregation ATPase FtsK/SpoIIIE